MNQISPLEQPRCDGEETRLLEADILEVCRGDGGTHYEVRVEGLGRRAGRAAGCLLSPLPGDRVLLARLQNREHMILTVLTRDPKVAAEIEVPGADALSLKAQRLRLEGEQDAEIRSQRLEVACGRIALTGRLLALAVDVIDAFARKLEAHVHHRRSSSVEVVEECDVAVRRVRGVDSHSARQLILKADETLMAEAENALVVARKHVRVDGEQISMG